MDEELMKDMIAEAKNALGELWPMLYRYDPVDDTIQCQDCGRVTEPDSHHKMLHDDDCSVQKAEDFLYDADRIGFSV